MTGAKTIPHYRMSFPAGDSESFDAYRAMVAPVFESAIPNDLRDKPFSNVTDTLVLDGIFVSHGRGTALDFDRTHATIARGGVDEIIVNLYEDAARLSAIDGVERVVAPGQIAVLDLSRTFRVRAPAIANTSLMISRRRFEERFGTFEDLHGTVMESGAIHSLLLGHIRWLRDTGRGILEKEAAAVSAVTLDLIHSCLKHVGVRQAEASPGALSLPSLKAAVEQNLSDPKLGPASLMRQFGLSRPALYRLFEPAGGVADYIHQRRLRRAFRLLTDPSFAPPRVSRLAFELGFGSPTAFGRAFREKFGMTPSDVQSLAWRPLDPADSPWRIPKIAERFVTPFAEEQRDVVRQYIVE